MALAIGPLQLEVPFVQAALSGYSDYPMRSLARRFGAPYTLNEVVLDKLVVQKGKIARSILNLADDDHPVGGQLMGSDPDMFAPAADAMARAGYDVIDINFGCPVKKVLGRCRGGFLLSTPKEAIEIIRSVCGAVGKTHPVTVKLRRGMDDRPESERNFFQIVDGAFEIGVSAITVHGRTVLQRYVGPSNWSFLAKVKKHVGDRIMFGSGDLFSAESCIKMIHETGVDGVTIARGCIGNPWIFRDCRALWNGQALPPPPSIAQQRDAIASHTSSAVDTYGDPHAYRILRKFGVKYAELHPLARQVRNAFIAVRNGDDFHRVLESWYDPAADWPSVVRSDGHGDLIAAGASM